jgi:carbon monoxide dehydrogenase subunit G
MIIEKRFVIDAPIETVWNFLLDAPSLASCVPGCEHVETVGDNAYSARMKARIGPISVNFKIRIDITEMNPPRTLKSTIRGEDSRMASHLNASSVIELNDVHPERTEVCYRSEVTVLGRLGKFGEGIMRRKAKEVGEAFSRSVKERLSK